MFSLTNDNSYSYPVNSQNRTLVASKKLNLNFFDRFPTPNLRYVLPDEVAFSLGQGQRRRRQSATCLQKSLHRFLWIPFFISLLEPLVLRLFLFYASVIFFRNYHLSASLMKTNKFHYTFPLLLCFLYFEFWLFLFSFQLPNKKEAEGSIFIYTLPSNSMVGRKFLEICSGFLRISPLIFSGFAKPSHFIRRWSDQGEKNHPQACVSSSPQLSWIWRSDKHKYIYIQKLVFPHHHSRVICRKMIESCSFNN